MDRSEEIIERLTRVEVTMASFAATLEKMDRRLFGETGNNGAIGTLGLRLTAVETFTWRLAGAASSLLLLIAAAWAIVKFITGRG